MNSALVSFSEVWLACLPGYITLPPDTSLAPAGDILSTEDAKKAAEESAKQERQRQQRREKQLEENNLQFHHNKIDLNINSMDLDYARNVFLAFVFPCL